MEIKVELAGNQKVVGHFRGYHVVTDQPAKDGGGSEAPAPFELFLASLATCAGFFVQSFCQARGISTEGIEIVQTSKRDEKTHMVTDIQIKIQLPASFPEKYRASVVAAANGCTVKKHLLNPPKLEVIT